MAFVENNMTKYVKEREHTQKNGNLMEPGNENENKMIKNNVECNEEDDGATKYTKRK